MKFRGSKNLSKIIQKSIKNEAKMGMAVGIDFSWIFVDFDKQVGGKLEARCN